MKPVFLLLLGACFFSQSSFSQERIYRCGSEYTNTLPIVNAQGCKLMEGGNVTVVQGFRPPPVAPAAAATPASAKPAAQPGSNPGQRVDTNEQKSRDADARQILESELKKTEARQLALLKEYNNGEPERRSDETRNYQKYLDRVAEMKLSLARLEGDLAGLRRELGRLAPVLNSTANK